MSARTEVEERGLKPLDMCLLWFALPLWLITFLIGTLVSSEPYRHGFAKFEGGLSGTISNGVLVVATYTLTNVAILCILAGLLAALGAKAILGTDEQRKQETERDTTSPMHSAVLRSFFIYLALIAGVLLLGDRPADPTQIQYVRLAGLMSLAGFLMNYRPQIFGKLLERAGHLIAESSGQLERTSAQTDSNTK